MIKKKKEKEVCVSFSKKKTNIDKIKKGTDG